MEKKYFFKAIVLAFISCLIYFSIDYLNIIKSEFTFDDKFVYIIIGSMCILVLTFIIYNKNYKGLFSQEYNLIDYLNCYFLIVSLLLILSNIVCEHEIIINLIFSCITLIITIYRMFRILKYKESNISKSPNLHRLKDLYENKLKDDSIILLEERELEKEEYDILDLSFVRQNLIEFINECEPYHSFVLGLIGEWGIGKSSTIKLIKNTVKRNNKNIDISFFDPWIYNTNNDLMEGFCELISSSFKSDSTFQYQITLAFNEYRRLLFSIIDEQIGTKFLNSKILVQELEEKRDIINKLLIKSSVKRVFVIDNLDRINKEQLYYFFNIVNNLLNFNGIIFILCYDENVLNKLMSDTDYGCNYLEKIVNSKIYMPFIDKGIMQDIGKKCIENLLSHYNIKIKYKYEFNTVVSNILDDISNLRDLIRFINTLSSNLKIVNKYNLYINDFIALEYIKYSNNELYKFIYNNSYILCTNIDYFNSVEREKFERYMSSKIYMELLSYLFALEESNYYREINNENRCSDSNIISTYFSQKETISLRMINDITNLIDKINSQKVLLNDDSLIKLCSKYEKDEVLSILLKYADGIKNSTNLLRLLLLFDFSREISSLLDYIFEKDNNNISFKTSIIKKHNFSLYVLYSNYYINKGTYIIKQDITNFLKEHLITTADEVFENKISLFTSKNYNHQVLYILLKYTTLSQERVREYFTNIIVTPSSVFRVLASFITETIIKDRYSYIIEYDNILKYIDIELLDKCIENAYPLSTYQRRILRIYNTKEAITYIRKIDFSKL